MDIVLYLDPIYEFLALPPDQLLIRLLLLFGWIPFMFLFMSFVWVLYEDYLNDTWGSKQRFTFLAIDVPKGNEQSLRAVENLFTYLGGAHGSLNLIDKYVDGKFQLSFSFEVVSIGGYTQFIIRTPVDFRSMVESAVYSQYPDAEITEIQDYTTGFPKTYPDDEHDVWGAEFVLTKPDVYPIKTYKDFEHNFGKPETQFRDSMASLMDLTSSLRAGENIWFQMIVMPIDFEWVKKGGPEIAKVMGEKPKAKAGFMSNVADEFANWIGYLTGVQFNVKVEPAKDAGPAKMMDLRPEQKNQVEKIQEKISKLGFMCKLRYIYIASKDVMNKPKGVNGFVGFIKQFGVNELNGFKPDTSKTGTSTAYFAKAPRLNARKGRIVRNYMARSLGMGKAPFVLNVEELATLWHFPIESVVKAPLIQKTPGRKAEPPNTLPISEEISSASSMLDEIFVMEQPNIRPATQDYTSENIFDLNLEEEGPEGGNKTAQADLNPNDPFADIFVEPSKPAAPLKTSSVVDRGAPPTNLPFA